MLPLNTQLSSLNCGIEVQSTEASAYLQAHLHAQKERGLFHRHFALGLGPVASAASAAARIDAPAPFP
jgi:hypothetical protein